MTKLTKAQRAVIEDIKQQIAYNRQFKTFAEKFGREKARGRYNSLVCKMTLEQYIEWDPDGYKRSFETWEMNVKGYALTCCNTKTLYKLERLGYIEIIKDANGKRYGVDLVKLIEK